MEWEPYFYRDVYPICFYWVGAENHTVQADVKSSYFMFPGDQFFLLKVSDPFAAVVEIGRYGSF